MKKKSALTGNSIFCAIFQNRAALFHAHTNRTLASNIQSNREQSSLAQIGLCSNITF